MYVSGLDARKGLLASTIASEFIIVFLFHRINQVFRRHQALHTAKSQSNVCRGCKKTFSRLDALNVCLELSLLLMY